MHFSESKAPPPAGATRLSDAQFPVLSEMHEDESGLGYCLRLAELNGVGLSQLKRLAGLGPNDSFRSTHAATLARLFSTDPSGLAHRLADLHPERSTLYGHRFERRGMLRIRKSQICALCIHESGYAKDAWDIGVATCCLTHSRCLMDICPNCLKDLSWNRPSIKWCKCGHYLGMDASLLGPCEDTQIAQRILELIMRRHSTTGLHELNVLIQPFTEMSLGGWIELLFALGLKERPWQPIRLGSFSFAPAASQTQKIVPRALRRLQTLMSNDTPSVHMAPCIYEVMLGNLAFNSRQATDSSLCRQLYARVFGSDRLIRLQRYAPCSAQLDMFMDLS